MSLPDLIELLHTPWAIAVVAFFFGASIFVHELGHFLAARWRGLHVERFSIGFGPKVLKWKRGGVEYCLSLLPLGGYVALPQLADMRGLEGEPAESSHGLPPIGYADKMWVAVAGAVFNVIFAFILATVLWGMGRYASASSQTTTIGYVAPALPGPDGEMVPSPAALAGILPGDRVREVDGRPVRDWMGLHSSLIAGTRREPDGRPVVRFTVERAGETLGLDLHPILSQRDGVRQIGVQAQDRLVVDALFPNSPAALAGLQAGDELLRMDGVWMGSFTTYVRHLREHADRPLEVWVRRGNQELQFSMAAERVVVATDGTTEPLLGIQFRERPWLIHVHPLAQMWDDLKLTWKVLGALLSRGSDIGLSQLSGPIGIGHALYQAARVDLRFVLALTILININLALLNLLPIPVLDGGHMAFATVARLIRRPIPPRLILASQNLFVLLLLSLVVYVSFFDLRRVGRSAAEDRAFEERRVSALTPVFGRDPDPGGVPEAVLEKAPEARSAEAEAAGD